MKTIIALTNFSETSNNAVNYAADMCQALNAELVLMHIIQTPVSFDVPMTENEYNTMQQDADDELARLKEKILLRNAGGVTISAKVTIGGMLNEIKDACEAKKPLLVIIGAEKRNWAERFILGSNTFSSVKNLHYPVLVVPGDATFKHINRIALASDFQDIDEVQLEILRQLVKIFNASVDVIHVTSDKEEELKNAASFGRLKAHLKEFNPHMHFITGDGSVEQAINNYAERHDDDLVMVISRKHNFFEALLHKSQSRQISLNPHTPILAVSE